MNTAVNTAAKTADYDVFIRKARVMRSEYMTSAFRGAFKALLSPLTRILERQRLRAAFAGMDERILQDIGLSRSDIEASVDRCVPPRSFGSYFAAVAEAFAPALRGGADKGAGAGLSAHLRRDIGAWDAESAAARRPLGWLERVAGGLADPLHSDIRIANDTDRRAA